MPASRIRQNKAKRPRIPSEDRTDGPEKRPRNGTESPLSSSPNSIHILRDRSRIAWQNKGKWRERTPKRTPMSLAQAADDLFTGTSAQGALVNAALSPQQLDTSILEIASTIHGSSPISPKDVPIPETPIMNQAEEKLQEEIERLRRQLEQKDQIIARHESTIETVQNCVYCPICLDPLWKPLVVVPCGHMACQGCLISWFTSPVPGHADEPDPHMRRKRKTCPHCRGTVTTRPVEIYGLGGAVAALHPQPPQPPSDIDASIDPWADIFRPPLVGPVRDHEDGGIRRCPTCFYEIFDGECVGCGRAFSDESGHTAFGSDDGSVSVFDDDPRSIYGGGGSLYGGTLYGDEGSDGGDSVYGAEIPVFDYPPRARVYDSYDEDEDEDDSFIDDAELPQPPPAAYFNHYAVSDSEEEPEDGGYLSARASRASPVPIHRVNSYTGSSSSSSSGLSDDDDEEDDFLPGRGRRGRSVETDTLPETAEEADDEDDDEEDEASVNPNATIDLVSDDDDEPPVRSMGRRSAAERWGGWSRAEGEPPRGRSLSRRRVVSDGSEDGSEYFSD